MADEEEDDMGVVTYKLSKPSSSGKIEMAIPFDLKIPEELTNCELEITASIEGIDLDNPEDSDSINNNSRTQIFIFVF